MQIAVRILIILISTIGFINSVQGDTIDYWIVYYNKVKIKEYNQYSKGEVILEIKDIKKTDSLIILYFRDTPCESCETQVTIENGEHLEIVKGKGMGTFKQIRVSVFDIFQYDIKVKNDYYEVYYEEKGATRRTLIFKVKLE